MISFKSFIKLFSLLIIPRSIFPTVAASVDKIFKEFHSSEILLFFDKNSFVLLNKNSEDFNLSRDSPIMIIGFFEFIIS